MFTYQIATVCNFNQLVKNLMNKNKILKIHLLTFIVISSRLSFSKNFLTNFICFLSVLLASMQVEATEGGYSNYVPGTYGDFGVAIEPTTNLTIRNDIYYYQADDNKSIRSGELSVGAGITFTVNMTTLLYKPDIEIFGAQYSFGTLIPLAHYEIESDVQRTSDINSGGFTDSADVSGLGDIVFVPWVLFWNEGNWHTTFSQFVIAPTADYSATAPINTGLNYWTFDTNVAATHLDPNTGTEYSLNMGHIYNTENSDTNYHSGRELHIDYAINQFFSEKFALGIQGYYWRQISDDKGEGAILGGFKGKSAGIGPAALWATQIDGNATTFIVKWIHEYEAEKRIKGNHVMASFSLGF